MNCWNSNPDISAEYEHFLDEILNTEYFQAKDVKSQIENSNRLESALSRLLLLQENYPDLKANESFLRLQDSLEGTENRIAVFPWNLVLGI
jgi:hypothetical protein